MLFSRSLLVSNNQTDMICNFWSFFGLVFFYGLEFLLMPCQFGSSKLVVTD